MTLEKESKRSGQRPPDKVWVAQKTRVLLYLIENPSSTKIEMSLALGFDVDNVVTSLLRKFLVRKELGTFKGITYVVTTDGSGQVSSQTTSKEHVAGPRTHSYLVGNYIPGIEMVPVRPGANDHMKIPSMIQGNLLPYGVRGDPVAISPGHLDTSPAYQGESDVQEFTTEAEGNTFE